jgi:hypothetical protein
MFHDSSHKPRHIETVIVAETASSGIPDETNRKVEHKVAGTLRVLSAVYGTQSVPPTLEWNSLLLRVTLKDLCSSYSDSRKLPGQNSKIKGVSLEETGVPGSSGAENGAVGPVSPSFSAWLDACPVDLDEATSIHDGQQVYGLSCQENILVALHISSSFLDRHYGFRLPRGSILAGNDWLGGIPTAVRVGL